MRRRTLLILLIAALSAQASALLAAPACNPCTGLAVDDPQAAAALLAKRPALAEDAVFFVKWRADLTADAKPSANAIRQAGGTPWLAVEFATPAPLLDNLKPLEVELQGLARLASEAGEGAYFQIGWKDPGGTGTAADRAFLIKRASVAIAGASPQAQIISQPLTGADPARLRELYGEDLAAYLDGIAVAPAEPKAIEGLAALLAELDPGAILVIDGLPQPAEPTLALAETARYAAAGAAISLFAIAEPTEDDASPLKLIANEFRGDLSLDPYSVPTGAAEAWSFVRGSDLGLRVIARAAEGADSVNLAFSDSQLRNPSLFDPATGEATTQWGISRSSSGLEVELSTPSPAVLLSVERMSAAELQGILGVEEEVTVSGTRQIPVEEILRRLQAFEDGQARRLESYRAINTTHLRFQIGTGATSIETTFRGPYFYRQGEGFDWAWQEFFVNGVRWRGRSVPEIPLIQPERAARAPVDISFTRDYRYTLRGTGLERERDCWVIDFEPAVAVQPGRSLYQGTLWVDREIFARVQTRGVQVGLTGEVISNQETTSYSPVDAAGEPGEWSESSFFLPLRLVGQQIWSVLSGTPVVEREVLLTDIQINPSDFDAQREATLESDVTMIRDTPEGMRYLVVDEETGERVVEEGRDLNRRFLLGGVFYDESQDFPIPLAGINWLWFDWRQKGIQANVFFAGALANVAITDPRLFGSRWDAGFDVFALAIAGTDTVFRNDREIVEEDVKVLSPNIDFKLGHPIGNFFKLDLQYELAYVKFSNGDATSPEFVLPQDHVNHGFTLAGRYNRNGYRARLGGTYNRRSDWQPWGLPGNPDFTPDRDTFTQWSAAIGKTWHLPKFFKLGAELEYVGGSDLDRFSKYDFGPFSNVKVRGYQSGKIRAESAWKSALTYGFDVGGLFRLDLVGDVAWATDEASGLKDELLAGAGVVGTIVGPWRTVISMDVGAALAGPDDGVTALITVLKLFKR